MDENRLTQNSELHNTAARTMRDTAMLLHRLLTHSHHNILHIRVDTGVDDG